MDNSEKKQEEKLSEIKRAQISLEDKIEEEKQKYQSACTNIEDREWHYLKMKKEMELASDYFKGKKSGRYFEEFFYQMEKEKQCLIEETTQVEERLKENTKKLQEQLV